LAGPVSPRPPSAEALWEALASPDAARAYREMGTLEADPAGALPLFRECLRAVPRVEAAQLGRLLAALDADRFEDREKATAELEPLGDAARPALVGVARGGASLETRRRVTELLSRLDRPPPPSRLRSLRGIEVLEYIGDVEARAVLEKLAQGAPGALETEHARAALERLRSPGMD